MWLVCDIHPWRGGASVIFVRIQIITNYDRLLQKNLTITANANHFAQSNLKSFRERGHHGTLFEWFCASAWYLWCALCAGQLSSLLGMDKDTRSWDHWFFFRWARGGEWSVAGQMGLPLSFFYYIYSSIIFYLLSSMELVLHPIFSHTFFYPKTQLIPRSHLYPEPTIT